MAAQRLVRGAFTALLVAALPGLVVAQSSIFGVRGLGHPGRPLTPAARATGGSFAPFDAESDGNPAALGQMRVLTGNFVMAPTWRNWEGPAGTADLRETTRGPQRATACALPPCDSPHAHGWSSRCAKLRDPSWSASTPERSSRVQCA